MAKETKEAQAAPVAADPTDKTQVQPVGFPDVSDTDPVPSTGQFDIFLDVDAAVTVVLGKVEIPVRRLLQLGPGAVLELDKSIEAPVDLYLQETKFAEGDVVVVDDCFAIRIKQIMGLENASEAVSAS
jgi:flagellar motor switch protein FliN